MIKIIDPVLSPALTVKEALIDGDGSMCIYLEKAGIKPEPNTAFFWMIETWLKRNEIPYKVDIHNRPFTSEVGIRIFGSEISDIDFFINNLQ